MEANAPLNPPSQADPARPYLNPEPPATPQARAWQAQPQGAAFQYQLSEQFSAASNTVAGVSVYFVDLFDTPEAEVRAACPLGPCHHTRQKAARPAAQVLPVRRSQADMRP
jgi:hypothetical protein